MTAPSTRQAVAERPMQAVDLEYRGHRYRLTETVRDAGASVRPAGEHLGCLICPRRFRPETRCAVLPDGSGPLCLPCALKNGALYHLPACIEDDERAAEDALSAAGGRR